MTMPAASEPTTEAGLTIRRLKPLRSGRAAAVLLIVNVIVASAIGVELAARAFVYAFERWAPDERVNADAYAGAEWPREYYREFRLSGSVDWHSYVYWRRRPYDGRFINIDGAGVRRTWQPAVLAPNRIFVMGGSTVWGTGSRDDETLPSHIARDLSAAGRSAVVVNYGESGYVTEQSIATLLERLRAGDVPNVVAFYVGAEDVFSAFQNDVVGVPQNEANRAIEFNATQPDALSKVFRVATSGLDRVNTMFRRPSPLGPRRSDTDALAAAITDRACRNRRLVDGLAAEFGFVPVWFLQPIIFTKPLQTTYEQFEAARYEASHGVFQRAYARLRESNEGCGASPLHDVSGVFAAERRPVFLDAFHISEDGNRRVAQAMESTIASALNDHAHPK